MSITERENRKYVKELVDLIEAHPDYQIFAWIDSDGIYDEYAFWRGYFRKPRIEEVAVVDEHYMQRDENDKIGQIEEYFGRNCYPEGEDYDTVSDEWVEEKWNSIPWEKIIAVNVGVYE